MLTLKSFWLAVLVLFATPSLFAQQTDSAYVRQNYTKIERRIAMRDGIKLFTSIYIPKDQSKKYPILLNQAWVISLPKCAKDSSLYIRM
jgi:predicted acyl esterase